MVRQAMVIHLHTFHHQCLSEILLRRTTFVGSRLHKDFSDSHQFLVKNGDFVAAHPPFGHGNGLGRTQVYHHPIILGRHQLPRASHQVQTDNPSAVESFLECLGRRSARPHLNGPPHHAVFLCLHGPHVADHLGWIAELRRNKLLIKESDGYCIHFISDC